MNKPVYATLILMLLLSACARETVLLLPTPDGRPGAVVVTPKQGEAVVVDKAGTAVDVSGDSAGAAYAVSEERIRKEFGATLDALPIPPKHFLLYFTSGTADLLPESAALLPQVLETIKERLSTDVSVVGHADREGDPKWNYTLSRRRAETVSVLLKDMGVNPEHMEITSHGEENPLVPTADNVAEPRNRRVEVIVR